MLRRILPAVLFLLAFSPLPAYADGELIEYVGKEDDIHPVLILAEFVLVVWGGYKLATWFAGLGKKEE